VSVRDDSYRIETMLDRPLSPDTGNRWCGIDENSVHIKEEGGALDLGHEQYQRINILKQLSSATNHVSQNAFARERGQSDEHESAVTKDT
jgi:glucokinase